MANGIGARSMNDLDNLTQSVLHDNPNLIALGIALSLGLLIGAQRGWADRARAAGERIAGVRTHALTGLLGGCAGLMTPYTSPWTLGAVLIAVAWMCVTSYRERLQRT
ncbi:MAG: MgtC/SapB family protein, partial [Gammaproteobacteria bacterium]|nr:MgtC/SapB family protein [Gammaproteobacteria bacterium]